MTKWPSCPVRIGDCCKIERAIRTPGFALRRTPLSVVLRLNCPAQAIAGGTVIYVSSQESRSFPFFAALLVTRGTGVAYDCRLA